MHVTFLCVTCTTRMQTVIFIMLDHFDIFSRLNEEKNTFPICEYNELKFRRRLKNAHRYRL